MNDRRPVQGDYVYHIDDERHIGILEKLEAGNWTGAICTVRWLETNWITEDIALRDLRYVAPVHVETPEQLKERNRPLYGGIGRKGPVTPWNPQLLTKKMR